MAKEKKEKRCKECEGKGKECKCPPKSMRKGYYGLHDYNGDEEHEAITPGESLESMGEAIKEPRKPQDSDRGMKGMSRQKKEKKMSEFKKAAEEAKKRKADKARSDELYMERRKKGVKFYDAKGSGYIRDGKKHYD